MKAFHKRMILIIILLVITVFLLYHFGLDRYLSLEHIKANAGYLQEQVLQHYVYSIVMFIAISVALMTFTLPVTAPMAVTAGFLFGFAPGVLYTMIAIIIGASISFLVARYVLSHVMKMRYGDRLARFNERINRYGYSYLITLQFLTVVPYFIINTLAALAGVSFIMFLVTTIIGAFPIVVIYTFAGRQLYKIDTWKDILSKEMLLVLLLLAVLALLPMLIQKWRKRELKDENAL